MDGGERGMRQLTLPALYPRRRAGKTKPAAGKYARRASNRRMASLKRRMPAWMARAVRPAIIASATLILLFGGIAAWRTGGIAALGEAAGESVLAWTGSAGIAVDNVLVEGREKTSAERILAALEVQRGMPLFAFSPDQARERLLAIGWVRDARIERRLPDTIFVDLVERRPAAIWQNKGKFALVDETGAVIGAEDIGQYSDLKVIVGPDAPENFAELFDMLESQPDLKERVVAAVRIGSRRWNVKLDNDMTVLLPEGGIEQAWATLAAAVAKNELLERNVTRIDLRMPDRVTVRRAPAPKGVGDKGV
jgi:cell division protein FtsQ